MIGNELSTTSETPEQLWELACRYFKWADENPIEVEKTLVSGKEAGRKVTENLVRPYSIKALCLFCNISEEYLLSLRELRDKTSLYHIVASKILYVVYTQAYEYAQVGVFNPIFTMKVLGMDKEDTGHRSIQVNIVQGLPELASSEEEVLQQIEEENSKSDFVHSSNS